MTLLEKCGDATDRKFEQLKEASKVALKASRQVYKQSKTDRDRKVVLAGVAVLRRIERGEMDEADFRQMMDDALSRPVDRALFDLD